MKAEYARRLLDFKFVARTSRNEMTQKETFFIRLTDSSTGKVGVGECPIFRGLSADDTPDFESRLASLCSALSRGEEFDISNSSALIFGLETAKLDLESDAAGVMFDTPFSRGEAPISINGLVWMDSIEKMLESAAQKVEQGFKCVKIKIGQHDFEREVAMLDAFRRVFGPDKIELRLDANGAFGPDDALGKLKRLSVFDIHSIEQPIKAGQWEAMADLCQNSPIDIALDEELIGVADAAKASDLLSAISPRHIILKPALCGGVSGAEMWIREAESRNIGWWATSALESNVGLEAIAQWVATHEPAVCQGLGTGSLYTNNFISPLSVKSGALHRDASKKLIVDDLQWINPE